MTFTGKSVQVSDLKPQFIDLQTPDGLEQYCIERPKMTVGNLIIGERYIQPYGDSIIINQTTMETCTLTYKSNGWNQSSKNKVTGEVKDPNGESKIKIKGQFTGVIEATDIDSLEKWTMFEAPKDIYPDNYKM
jgi:hypothetical protein